MTKQNTNEISQFEIDYLIKTPKIITSEGLFWKKKSILAKDPAWLFLNLTVYDTEMLAIPYFTIEMKYRPAIDNQLLAKISFTAIYKTYRIFAIDVGTGLVHRNAYWQDTSLRPQPIPEIVKNAHFHIRHEKYGKETGYPIEKEPNCVQNAFSFYLNEFLTRFNLQAKGEIPHPYYRPNEDKLL